MALSWGKMDLGQILEKYMKNKKLLLVLSLIFSSCTIFSENVSNSERTAKRAQRRVKRNKANNQKPKKNKNEKNRAKKGTRKKKKAASLNPASESWKAQDRINSLELENANLKEQLAEMNTQEN